MKKKKVTMSSTKEIAHKTERLTVSDVGGSSVGSVGSAGGGASPPIPGNATRDDDDTYRFNLFTLI